MSSVTQGNGFTEVNRGRKKHKVINSPALPSQHKPGSFEPPLRTPVRPKPSIKNLIPAILSGGIEKFKNRRVLMGELGQFHSSLKISQIKELPKGDFVVIGDSLQYVIILQSESKMKELRVKTLKSASLKPSKQSTTQKSCYRRSSYRYNGLGVYRIPWSEQSLLLQGWMLKKQKRLQGSSQSFDLKLTTLPNTRFFFSRIKFAK